jgi:hypothetical protein
MDRLIRSFFHFTPQFLRFCDSPFLLKDALELAQAFDFDGNVSHLDFGLRNSEFGFTKPFELGILKNTQISECGIQIADCSLTSERVRLTTGPC